MVSGAVTASLVLLVVWLFDISLGRAMVLAPVIVVAFGAGAAVLVLWSKVAWEALRRREHPWAIVALAAAAVAVLIALSMLGLRLPQE